MFWLFWEILIIRARLTVKLNLRDSGFINKPPTFLKPDNRNGGPNSGVSAVLGLHHNGNHSPVSVFQLESSC